jgi:hypothetical protein
MYVNFILKIHNITPLVSHLDHFLLHLFLLNERVSLLYIVSTLPVLN